jgi:hypothetical protein
MLNIATYSYTHWLSTAYWIPYWCPSNNCLVYFYMPGSIQQIQAFFYTARSYPYRIGSYFFTPRDIFSVTILIHASSILCFINLHMHVLIFLYVIFMQITSRFLFVTLSFIKYNITFSHTLCQKHEAITCIIIFHTTLFDLTLRDYYSVLRLLHMMNVRFSLLNMAQRILGFNLPNF